VSALALAGTAVPAFGSPAARAQTHDQESDRTAVQPAPPAGEAAPSASAEAAYRFALAKMLIDDGDYQGAQTAFQRALELDPKAPYVRIEYAQFLARLGRFGRTHEARLEHLKQAVDQAEKAQQALPGNVDALRAVATTNLALGAEDPSDSTPMAAAVAAFEKLRTVDPHDVRSLLSLGQIYLRRGEPAAAAEVFEEIVAETPGYRPVYRLLAESLMQSKQMDKAADALKEVLATEPDSEPARLALAEILADRGDHKQAAQVLREAPEPLESVDARTRLATELYLSGDLDGALEELDALAKEVPDSRYVSLLRGLVLSAQARNEEALQTLEPLLGGGPGDADLAITVSQLLVRQEREPEAVKILTSTLARLDKEGPAAEAEQVRMALARLYASLDRWEEVESALAPLLGKTPSGDDGLETEREAVLLDADALVEQKRGEQALDRLNAWQAKDDDPSVIGKRAEVLARTGHVPEAVAVVDGVDPAKEPEAFLEAVQGLQRAERYAESIPPLQRFLAAKPDATEARFLLGTSQERSGDRDAAVKTFSALIADQPDYHPALNYLGYMWIEKGKNLDKAMDMVRRAVALDPDNGAYIDSLGWGYFQLGRLDEARKSLERASRLIRDPTVYEHLGDVYAALGKADEARRAYHRAMVLQADDPATVERKLSELDHPSQDKPDLPQQQR
jgi:predicted Zn-dependent protease